MEALLNHFVASDTNPNYSPYMAVGAKFTTFAPPQTYNVLPATIAAAVAEGYLPSGLQLDESLPCVRRRADQYDIHELESAKGTE